MSPAHASISFQWIRFAIVSAPSLAPTPQIIAFHTENGCVASRVYLNSNKSSKAKTAPGYQRTTTTANPARRTTHTAAEKYQKFRKSERTRSCRAKW